MARDWPTPMATDGNKPSAGNRRTANLTHASQMWMTPTARDHKDGATTLANTPVNGLLGRQVLVTPMAGSDTSEPRRTLNPRLRTHTQSLEPQLKLRGVAFMTAQDVPFYKRQIPKDYVNAAAVVGSFIGLCLSALALFGISFGCTLSWGAMTFALIGVLPQIGWWVDRFSFLTILLPMVLSALLILAVAFFWVKSASSVCAW